MTSEGLSIKKIVISETDSLFTDKVKFTVSLHSDYSLEQDLCFRVIYAGHPADDSFDQELSKVWIGPITRGINRFTMELNAPDPAKVPEAHFYGLNVILFVGYTELPDSTEEHEKLQQFVRVGYYVNVVDPTAEDAAEPDGEDITDVALIKADQDELAQQEAEGADGEGSDEGEGVEGEDGEEDDEQEEEGQEEEQEDVEMDDVQLLDVTKVDLTQVRKVISDSPMVKYEYLL
ncbi:Histone chaperone ASF1-like [Carpediemonas membranifera]|uniref:Histone chaperone ASF1-like n=1 Tax=Carpediemonas membranifera TaxID=201153 RepID=A0A8J6E6Z3_9EUKA|nr:Histone chaperone ASF1-like [Carpediemonas membranifera]|eukprot:KAG9390100.1 Histone chaperone ASF1-like [Carpediemonas membranifera]